MSWQKSVAIIGIWVGTGLSSMAGDVVSFVALMAVVSTFIIVVCREGSVDVKS